MATNILHKPFLILMITMLLFSGCKKETIKIGFTGNLTGTSSEIAVQGMYGVNLALDIINENGGVNGQLVELIVENDGNSVETAVAADTRLIEQNVVGIIGHMISGVAEQSVAYINDQQIVMISPTISSSDFSNQDDFFFTMVPVSEYQSVVIAKVINDLGYDKTACLYQIENLKYSQGFVEDVINELEVFDLETIYTQGFSQSDDELFNQSIEKIINSGIDSLIIAGSAYDVARYAQVLRSRDVQIPIFTSTWAMSPDLITIAGPAAEGIYSINTYDENSASDSFLDFQSKYIEKYGSSPTFSSVYAYEATFLLVDAIEKSHSLSGKDLKDAIDKNNQFRGLQGDMSLNEYGDALRTMFVFRVQDGKFVKVD